MFSSMILFVLLLLLLVLLLLLLILLLLFILLLLLLLYSFVGFVIIDVDFLLLFYWHCFLLLFLLFIVVLLLLWLMCCDAALCLCFQEPEPSPAQSSFSDENQRSHEEFKSHSQIQAYACQLEQNGMEPGSELTQIMIQSSKLAAAIVNSAPVLRREVFLQPSCSIDYLDTSGVYSVDSALKRRTWHVDRVTVRMLSVLGESESSLASLPSFNRSISNDTSNKSTIHTSLVVRFYIQ